MNTQQRKHDLQERIETLEAVVTASKEHRALCFREKAWDRLSELKPNLKEAEARLKAVRREYRRLERMGA